MPRRTTAIAAALTLLALGSPLMTSCADSLPLEIQYYNQGVEKHDVGNYQGAIDDYTKAIDVDPQNAYAYYNRGKAKYDLLDYQGAIADYTKAIEINPQFASAYSIRGMSKYLLGDLKGACDDARKAADLGDERSAERVRQCSGMGF